MQSYHDLAKEPIAKGIKTLFRTTESTFHWPKVTTSVSPRSPIRPKPTKNEASVERMLHDSLVRITIRKLLFFTSRKRK